MTRYEIVLEGRQGVDDMLTVLHYEVTGSTPHDWQALADLIRVKMVDELQAVLNPICTYQGITIREDIEGSIGLTVPFTLGVLTGTKAVPESVRQVCALVRKSTGTLTRPNRGRIFQGGFSMEFTTPTGVWETSLTDALQAFWTEMLNLDFSGPSNAQMVVKASDPTKPNTVEQNTVTTISVAGTPVVMKRRKPGVGS